MSEIFLQSVYIISAISGIGLYNYTGFLTKGKPNGEKYEKSKLLHTLMTGGFLSLITSIIAYVSFGFQPYYVLMAIINGAMFSAGIDKMNDMNKEKDHKANAERNNAAPITQPNTN